MSKKGKVDDGFLILPLVDDDGILPILPSEGKGAKDAKGAKGKDVSKLKKSTPSKKESGVLPILPIRGDKGLYGLDKVADEGLAPTMASVVVSNEFNDYLGHALMCGFISGGVNKI